MSEFDDCEHPRALKRALAEHNEMKKQFDNMDGRYQGWPNTERRQYGGLTDEQVEQIRDAILASIYEDIGRSIVKKILWAGGAVFAALLVWAASKGYITVTPPKP